MERRPPIACVLAEGKFDASFLTKLIAEERGQFDIEVMVARGKSSLVSIARTLLAVNRIPVAVVIDADTTNPDAARAARSEAEEVIGLASFGIPFRVLMAVPELESLFFQNHDFIQRVFGAAYDDRIKELAEFSPRRTLEKLAPGVPMDQTRADLLDKLDDSDIRVFRDLPIVSSLIDFLHAMARSRRLGPDPAYETSNRPIRCVDVD